MEEEIKEHVDPIEEKKTSYDASDELTPKEARAALKELGGKVPNRGVDAFVRLQGINKVYPNGVQAVFDFNLDIDQHEFIVLVGPSGCGKSTTLSMVAGLSEITSGYLYIDQVLSNYLPAKDRDISMVFQSYALYPQMTVYDNIAFPLTVRKYRKPLLDLGATKAFDVKNVLENHLDEFKGVLKDYVEKGITAKKPTYLSSALNVSDAAAKVLALIDPEQGAAVSDAIAKADAEIAAIQEKYAKNNRKINEKGEVLDENDQPIIVKRKLNKKEIRDKVFHAAKMLDLGPYLDRRPRELSGGQMQRVALGRAIVRDAKVFLMDEPLSNLDAKLRVQMRSEIVALHEKIGATTIYVTHDQTEAMTMANRIVIMSQGWVQQVGKPQEVYHNPANLFVATFIGSPAMNIYEGTYENGSLTFLNGYKVKLGKDVEAKHKAFYEAKIADTKRMLALCDDSVEVKAKELYDAAFEKKDISQEEALGALNEIKEVLAALDKPLSGDRNRNAVQQAIEVVEADGIASKRAKMALSVLKNCLNDVETVSQADLAKIHSAQAYKESSSTQKIDVLTYEKKGEKNGFFAKMKKRRAEKAAIKKLGFIVEDPKGYLEGLLESYEKALEGAHNVKIGIRPEHIHLSDEYDDKNRTEPFVFQAGIVELLGNELLVHGTWNDVDTIAKISTGTIVESHRDVSLSIDSSKIHVFDAQCGDTII